MTSLPSLARELTACGGFAAPDAESVNTCDCPVANALTPQAVRYRQPRFIVSRGVPKKGTPFY